MLERVLEPEIMDSAAEAAEYDAMDHTAVNARFATDFLAVWGASAGGRVLDVGTGTALIALEVCRRAPLLDIVATDLSEEMLAVAARHVERAGLTPRLHLVMADALHLPFADGAFDAVMSNSLVHHLPAPAPVWGEAHRVLAPGGCLFVRDLRRPDTAADLEALVTLHASGATEVQQQLLRQSLAAALTVDEVTEDAQHVPWKSLTVCETSDRHWTLTAVKGSAIPAPGGDSKRG